MLSRRGSAHAASIGCLSPIPDPSLRSRKAAVVAGASIQRATGRSGWEARVDAARDPQTGRHQNQPVVEGRTVGTLVRDAFEQLDLVNAAGVTACRSGGAATG